MAHGAEATVGVVGTGGTIQNTESGRIGVGALLAQVSLGNLSGGPALPALVHDDVFTLASEDLGPSDWVKIAHRVQEFATSPETSGVVVTHGTYTAEETSYFLHLCVRTEKPIAVTCSQRRHGLIGNDGDRNLVDAIRVAAAPGARGVGCVLVAGEDVHSARDVAKTSQRPGGFASGTFGPIGSVETDAVSIYRSPTRRHTHRSEFATVPMPATMPTVEIVETYPGAGTLPLRAAIDGGAEGVVLNGFTPSGMPTKEQREVLIEAIGHTQLPVVVVGRGRWGRVPSARDAVPWVTGDNLSAYKARVLLMVAIAAKTPGTSLQRIFDEY